MEEFFYPSKDGKHSVHACIWSPEGEPRGIVQIIHGMSEYIKRYSHLAEFLASRGFIVCGEDHLGHGETAKNKDELGYFADGGDYKIVLSDIRELHCIVRARTEPLPYFVLGHSMGSFFCRNYIALYGSELAGAIIVGTGFKSKLILNSALALVKLNWIFCGARHRSKFIEGVAFGAYNKRFKPVRTKKDWLSVDCDNVDRYIADPFCGIKFTNNGYRVLFKNIKDACSKRAFSAVPKSLPILIVAGENDPVGDYGKGVEKTYKKYSKAKLADVTLKLYPEFRHEILNDRCRDEVENDISAFLNSRIEND